MTNSKAGRRFASGTTRFVVRTVVAGIALLAPVTCSGRGPFPAPPRPAAEGDVAPASTGSMSDAGIPSAPGEAPDSTGSTPADGGSSAAAVPTPGGPAAAGNAPQTRVPPLRVVLQEDLARVGVSAVAPDGLVVATAASDSPTVEFRDARSGSVRARLAAGGTVGGLTFGRQEGSTLLLVREPVDGLDRWVAWNTATGTRLAALDSATCEPVAEFLVDRDAGRLAVLGGPDDSRGLCLIEPTSGRLLARVVLPSGRPETIAFHPSGARVIVAAAGGVVEVRDAGTGEVAATWRVFDQPEGEEEQPVEVGALAFDPAGDLLAAAGHGGMVKLLDPATGESRATLRPPRRERSAVASSAVAFDRRGKLLAEGDLEGNIRVWNVTDRRIVWRAKTAELCFPAYDPQSINGWLPEYGRCVTGDSERVGDVELEGCGDPIHFVAFSPDASRLVSGPQLRVWDAADGEWLNRWPQSEDCPFAGPGGFVGEDLFVYERNPEWGSGQPLAADVRTGTEVEDRRLYSVPQSRGAVRVGFDQTGSRLLVDWSTSRSVAPEQRQALGFGETQAWNTVSAAPIADVAGACGDSGGSFLFSADGGTRVRRHCSALVPDRCDGVEVCRVRDGRTRVRRLVGIGAETIDLAIGADGERLAVLFGWASGRQMGPDRWGTALQLWTLATLENRTTLDLGSEEPWQRVVFSPDGRWVAAMTPSSAAPLVRVWSVASGELQAVFDTCTAQVRSAGLFGLAFSPGGRRLASAGPGAAACVWDIEAGGTDVALEGHAGNVRAVAFSSDGRLLATVDRESIWLWDPADGSLVRRFEAPWPVDALAFHPRAGFLAVAGEAGVEILRLADDARLRAAAFDGQPGVVWYAPTTGEWQVDDAMAAGKGLLVLRGDDLRTAELLTLDALPELHRRALLAEFFAVAADAAAEGGAP